MNAEIKGQFCWVTLQVPLFMGDCGRQPDWCDKLETVMMNALQREGLARLTQGLDLSGARKRDRSGNPTPVYQHAHSARWILEQLTIAMQRAQEALGPTTNDQEASAIN